MHLSNALLAGLLGLSCASCSSGTSGTGEVGDGGGGTTPVGATAATSCGLKEAKLSGSLDGTSVSQSYLSNGYSFVVTKFNGTLGTRGQIEIVLTKTGASSLGSEIASGSFTMPSEGPRAGDRFCIGGGTLTSSDAGYSFTVTNLSKATSPAGADAGPCTGAPITGELSGCVRGAK